ncbi:GTPase family protein [Photobacterium chitinilyticum]|uniref:GTPase n=1 Tax=Photobacterium chitinilyticum TaxID=2485123 RepID=A0A3S3RC29_9GAMM|nr:dynamin family protein [Photobacterium chitinilyticum]RWX57454.1 GTPase [Photobacterium chitinilyticum]
MKRTRNSIEALAQVSKGVVPLLAASLFIPVLILAVIGVVSLIQDGRWLLFAVLVAISSVAVIIPYVLFRNLRKADEQALETIPDYDVEPSGQWSEFDNNTWKALNQRIDTLLNINSEWDGLRDHALVLAMEVAEKYHPDKRSKELAFTAPEFLLMVEEVSHRYRHFLLNHVPFAEKIRLTTLKQGYQQKDKLGKAKQVYDIYRVFRAMTPAGLVAEARGQILGRIFDEVSDEVQAKLKRVLLQEVASVAIDLYSGRFAAKDSELGVSSVLSSDQEKLVAEVEPLRVAVIGQISAGKSSLINAIIGNMVAEVSALPSTDCQMLHRCEVEGVDWVHLVDLPGIDGSPETNALLLEQITNSDLVFWVLKANQSARQLDVALRQMVEAFYRDEKQRNRKKPRILALLSQVDRLQPVSEWHPPYDVNNPSSAKAETIKAALFYNQQQLAPDEIIPVAVCDDKANYNIEQIAEILLFNYENGINTQLNRRRLEHQKIDLVDQVKRLYRLGEKAFRHGRGNTAS